MDIMMMKTALPAAQPKGFGRGAAPGENPGASFPEHMHRQLGGGREGRDSMLGVAESHAEARGSSEPAAESPGEKKKVQDDSLAALLGDFMQQLQDIAQGNEPRSGEWAISFADAKQLAKLGKAAGMSEAELNNWRDQLQRQGDTLSLEDFFAALAQHFAQMEQSRPVSVPETELPLLEAILAKMGVEPEALVRLEEKAVIGDGRLDLTKFLEGLKDLEGQEKAQLSAIEAEQLRDLLGRAGATRGLQQALLGNLQSGWQSAASREQPLQVGLEQLENMLRQTLQEIEGQRPQVDLSQFFRQLDEVLAQSGFTKESVGWSPVVQHSVTAAYQELLKSVDLSQVRIESVKKAMEEAAQQAALEAEKSGETLSAGGDEEGFSFLEELNVFTEPKGAPAEEATAGMKQSGSVTMPAGRQAQGAGSAEQSLKAADFAAHEWRDNSEPIKSGPPSPRWTPETQQQTLAQVSQGVLKGLQNQEHHLVLRLYPREMGEVKVEMMVRDDHVSLSFGMENSKVKEMLESNLGQFRENLARQGFVLGECMVSVDQGDHSEAGDQQFRFTAKPGQGVKVKEMAGLPEDVLYRQADRPSHQGISLII